MSEEPTKPNKWEDLKFPSTQNYSEFRWKFPLPASSSGVNSSLWPKAIDSPPSMTTPPVDPEKKEGPSLNWPIMSRPRDSFETPSIIFDERDNRSRPLQWDWTFPPLSDKD